MSFRVVYLRQESYKTSLKRWECPSHSKAFVEEEHSPYFGFSSAMIHVQLYLKKNETITLNNNEKTFEIGANSMRVTTNINLCGEWRIRMPKNVIECRFKCENRYWIWFTCQMIVFLSLKNITSGNCSPFHANGRIFSIRCTCPNLLFNLLLVFWVSPEGIPET